MTEKKKKKKGMSDDQEVLSRQSHGTVKVVIGELSKSDDIFNISVKLLKGQNARNTVRDTRTLMFCHLNKSICFERSV